MRAKAGQHNEPTDRLTQSIPEVARREKRRQIETRRQTCRVQVDNRLSYTNQAN